MAGETQIVEVPGIGRIAFPKGTDASTMDTEISGLYKRHKLSIPDSPLVGRIMQEARAQGVDPHLAIRMVHQESGFNPKAVSKAGAIGLFQLMPDTAKEMGVTDPEDPEQNIRGGVGYLAKMLKQQGGDVRRALAAYNWGPGNVSAQGMDKMPAETRDYLQKLILASPQDGAGQPAAPGLGVGSTPTPPSGPDPTLTGLPPPNKRTLPTLAQTGQEMGEEMDPISQLGFGAVNAFNRTARGIGLHRALKAAGLRLDDSEPTGQVMGGVSEGAGGLATVGDIAATGTQLAAAAPKVISRLPAAVRQWMAANPATAAAAGGATSAAVMTPGGVEERAKEAATSGIFSGLLTKALTKLVKPAKMSERAEELYKATGELPPLHVGAESQVLRDVGTLSKGIPVIGGQLQKAEDRMLNTSVRQLFQNATPPGATNLMRPGESMKRGQLFQDLDAQYDAAYDALLRGRNVNVGNADRVTITRLIDRLAPSDKDAAVVHKVIGQYFPQHSGRISGKSWKELQAIIRSEGAAYSGGGTVAEQKIGEIFRAVDQHLLKMRNRSVPRDVARNLDMTDAAYRNGMLLKDAIVRAGGEEGVTPKMLAGALRKRSTDRALAHGTAHGQQIIDPLSSTLGNMDDPSVMSAFMGLRRLAIPTAAGGIIGGIPGAAAIPGAVVGMNVIGSTPGGAKFMFGKTDAQRIMADFLRNNPDFISRGATTATMQGVE